MLGVTTAFMSGTIFVVILLPDLPRNLNISLLAIDIRDLHSKLITHGRYNCLSISQCKKNMITGFKVACLP